MAKFSIVAGGWHLSENQGFPKVSTSEFLFKCKLGGAACLEEMEQDRSGRDHERAGVEEELGVAGEWGEAEGEAGQDNVRERAPEGAVYVRVVGNVYPIRPELHALKLNALNAVRQC